MEISSGLIAYFSVITGMTIHLLAVDQDFHDQVSGSACFYRSLLFYCEQLILFHQQDLINRPQPLKKKRNRIARDLHDDLGGVLTDIFLQIHSAFI